MLKRLLLIINPRSGKKGARNGLSAKVEAFSDYLVTVYFTKAPGDAENIVYKYGNEFDLVVCSGGDGTLNETINGLMRLDMRPPLGYIPAGTTNDYASTLKIPRIHAKAVDAIVNGDPFFVDIGAFGDRFFTYIASFGLLSEVGYVTSQETKNMLGRLAYFLEGMRLLTEISSNFLRIEYDGNEPFEGEYHFCAIVNTTSVGGLIHLYTDDVSLDDGLFEVMLIKKAENPAQLARVIVDVMQQVYNPEHVHFFHASKLKISSNKPIEWCLDGENGGEHTEVIIENRRRSIAIMRKARR